MRKLVAVAALIVAFAIPTAASAQIFIGARLGYGFPWGKLIDAPGPNDVKDLARGQVPIQLDLGLKLGKALAIGAYASYGFVLLDKDLKDACDAADQDCSAATLRFGAQANLHAENSPTTEFWGGVSLGYTQLKQQDTIVDEYTLSGFEGGLQGGFDFLLSPSFRFGPFASLTVAQFTKWDDGTNDGDVEDFADTAMHGWFQVGVRGMWGN